MRFKIKNCPTGLNGLSGCCHGQQKKFKQYSREDVDTADIIWVISSDFSGLPLLSVIHFLCLNYLQHLCKPVLQRG